MSIFTQGTVPKNRLMARIKELLVGAGWEDRASNPTSDYYCMFSTGESGDKELFFQYRSLPVNGSEATDINTTTAIIASYRLSGAYTPGAPGVAGTFARPSEAWRPMSISSAAVDPEVELNYWYTVNKDRIIMNIYTPDSLTNAPTMLYFGLPTVYTSEPLNRGLVAMTSYASSYAAVVTNDTVAELPSGNTLLLNLNYITLAPRSPNSAGIQTPSELLYGSASVGIRGKIDSLYFLPNGSVNDGDILRVGARRFRATQLGVSGSSSFPSPTIIYQIS